MKLLMVTHYFDSHPGGIELVARQIYRRLARPECEVTWAAADVTTTPQPLPHGGTLPLRAWNGIETATGLPLPLPSLGALKGLWSAVGRHDVVLLHDCLYLSNITAFIFARLRHKPVAIVQHIGMVPYRSFVMGALMKAANAIFTRPMLRSAEQVVFISQITRHHFDDLRYVLQPVLAFNGVDTEIFSPLPEQSDKAALRARFGLPADMPVALFVGRFVEKKGLLILERMARGAQQISWAFAGTGPLSPYCWNLKNVRVYADLHQDALADLYRASDVLVLPSTGEGFPLVVQEALACGLPVVCGRETATADDALHELVCGVQVAPEQPEQTGAAFLAAVLKALSEAPQPHIAMLRFQFAQERYSWQRAVDTYYGIVSRLARKADGSQSKHDDTARSADGIPEKLRE